MPITPSHISIGGLFERQFVFRIPKYQRSYAWEDPQIDDFIDDIGKCFNSRSNSITEHHFFGGLVCILERIPGSARQQQEVVDGQQRLSTFILLVLNVIKMYSQLATSSEVTANPATDELVKSRITRLKEKYLIYRDEVNRAPVIVDRLQMSKADHNFFKGIIGGSISSPTRDSHKKMLRAFTRLEQSVRKKILPLSSVSDKLDALKVYEDIISEDCTVIHIETSTKTEAYRLFQVLNDRGISLTDGDLLRSRTLELLDCSEAQPQQDYVENSWNDILKDTPKKTEEFLRSYYASVIGKRPGSTTLFDDFLNEFFPQHTTGVQTLEDADSIKSTVDVIKCECEKYKQIINGIWPYQISQPITQWDVERLRLLVVELDHSLCIPLLMAGCQLNQKKFSEIIQLIDIFVFRYKYICNNHVGSLGELYLAEAVNIRTDPTNYNVNSLRNKLHALQEENAQDEKFKLLLNDDLLYKPRGGNKLLKYFLITLEYYLAWHRTSTGSRPQCNDKSRIFDFANTTIEHLYPQNEDIARSNIDLENRKNKIGNLTILDPSTNNSLGNMIYEFKKSHFERSAVLMNREIAEKYPSWNINTFDQRTEDLLNAACRIFKV